MESSGRPNEAAGGSAVTFEAENVGKVFRTYARPWDRFHEALTRRPRHRAFHALRDVSFRLLPSESIGIIGENGAGKSTLLRIASGVSQPTTGRVSLLGKAASVLELGTGFHPEFTGRQNMRLNAAALGLGAEELEARAPAIIAFSELGPFIDEPIKRYSSGMRMRLAFSIATQIEPEVLIVDEALSVGDGYFQKKCSDHVLAFVESGRTLLFCSHAMYYVTRFCDKALWLREGEVAALGDANEVVREYESYLQQKRGPSESSTSTSTAPSESESPARFTEVRVLRPSGNGNGGKRFRRGEPLEVELTWKSEKAALGFNIAVGLNRTDDVEVTTFATHRDGVGPFRGATSYRLRLKVPELDLLKGRFTLYAYLLDEVGVHPFDSRVLKDVLEIESPQYEVGLVAFPHEWDEG